MAEVVREAWKWWDKRATEVIVPSLEKMGAELNPPSFLTREGYPTVASPAPLAALLIVYLGASVAGMAAAKLGTMKKRDGPTLRWVQAAHNAFLVALSAYMCEGLVRSALKHKYKLWGNAYDDGERDMGWFCFCFFASKLYEFLDTAIILAKGNAHQISVLHVYHHASIAIFWWMIAHRAPGGDSYFSAALNSFVHILMYSYYFLASVIKSPRLRSSYLWWGKYLTQLQMLQFVINFFQAVYCYLLSPYPSYLSGLLVIYMLSLLVLFANFYRRKHLSHKRSSKQA